MMLAGWGRYPRADCAVVEAHAEADVLRAIAESPSLIARGAGRSYGDAALNPAATLLLGKLDCFLDFNSDTGQLTCQAGALLSDIVEVFTPRGWFPPVTPGTKTVSVGGMIAADVHGKNHHREGSFGDHIDWFDIALSDGEIVRCSPASNSELFEATVGGMGLTGVILAACIRLKRVETDLIRQRTLRARGLEAVLDAFEATAGWTYSVAWIDCMARGSRLGRSLIYLGEHAGAADLPKGVAPYRRSRRRALRVPLDLPSWTLNGLSIRAFNEIYAGLPRGPDSLVELEPYFWPLDRLLDWNRIYGARGFVQYQCVLPLAAGREGLRELLSRVANHGSGAFLAVLKRMGPAGRGLLSFPMEGYTLAMDFPANGANLRLLTELDAVTSAHGGRLYLAKDARSEASLMAKAYPNLDRSAAVRARADPDRRFQSLQSQRLGL